MEAWICFRLATKDISRRIGLMGKDVLTLPLLDHTCVDVLLTYVLMCSKGGHTWYEEQDLHEKRPYLDVVYCHIYSGVGGRNQA